MFHSILLPRTHAISCTLSILSRGKASHRSRNRSRRAFYELSRNCRTALPPSGSCPTLFWQTFRARRRNASTGQGRCLASRRVPALSTSPQVSTLLLDGYLLTRSMASNSSWLSLIVTSGFVKSVLWPPPHGSGGAASGLGSANVSRYSVPIVAQLGSSGCHHHRR